VTAAQPGQGRKLVPKVILEGTRLTLKTDIAFALNRHTRFVGVRKYPYHSPVISAEWCGFTNRPWGRGLTNFAPDEYERAMETYRTWLRLFTLLPFYSWIIDRFHLSTRAHWIRTCGRDIDLAWLEQSLATLGFHLVLCWRREESFAAAREARVKVSGNPSQYDDLGPFIAEQRLLRELARGSRLPLLELDVSDGDVPSASDRIADWMAATGGLWADDSIGELWLLGRT
jgi:hypothetical protein